MKRCKDEIVMYSGNLTAVIEGTLCDGVEGFNALPSLRALRDRRRARDQCGTKKCRDRASTASKGHDEA
jgi:hypothetical protein